MEIFNSDERPVCFFDSGIGGLNLLYECARRLPDVKFVYYADNYNMPYGSLTKRELLDKADCFFKLIAESNPAAAVIACNTLTAECADYLRSKYKFPIIGIQPAVKPAAACGGKCLVLSTPSTASSASLRRLIGKFCDASLTEVVGCKELAAYVEQNIFDINEKQAELLLPETKVDTVVLGCTHYIFLKSIIRNFYNCRVFDGIDGTAAQLCRILGKNDHRVYEHQNYKKISQNVSFLSGNTQKNRKVFNLLSEKSNLLW